MKKFLRYYKWELQNELYTCIYFVAILSMYSILVLIHGERSVDILVMLEMLLVCYVVSIFQKVIFSEEACYSRKELGVRTLIWFLFSMVSVISMSIVLKWFDDMRPWVLGAFSAYLVLCFFAIWIGIHIANKIDTKNLNLMLSQYQDKRK